MQPIVEAKNSHAERYLELEGAYNVRDIGGYPTADGCQIRWRTVLRAGRLSELSPASQQALIEYGVRKVIDLRRSTELEDSPSLFANSDIVSYINLPLIEEESRVTKIQSLTDLYVAILVSSQKQIKDVLESIAEVEGDAVLINCTGGKDRTGIIIALLLGIANVPAEIIAEDYSLSNSYLTDLNANLRERVAAAGYDMAHFEMLLTSEASFMLDTLDYIEKEFGGVRAYLSGIGVTESTIQKLYDRLVVAPVAAE